MKHFQRNRSHSSDTEDGHGSPVARARTVLTMNVYPSENKHVAKVLPGLLLGSQQFADDSASLQCYKVTHILNATTEVQNSFPDDYIYKRIAITDSPTTLLAPNLAKAFRFIDEGRNRGCVLVHCFYGVSRSASIVIAYLIKSQRMRYSDSLEYLQMLRPAVLPNMGFQRQLKDFAAELRSHRTY